MAKQNFQKKAEKKNAKLIAEAPLFAKQMQEQGLLTTKEAEYWRWRRNRVLGAVQACELVGAPKVALQVIEERAIARLARHHLGDEVFRKMDDYCHRTYPCVDYWFSFWWDVLCGKQRIVYKWVLKFDPARIKQYNSDGRYLVEDGVWPPEGWTPPLTEEQLYELFPLKRWTPKPEQPDDGGLALRLERVLENQAKMKGGS